MHLRLLLHLLTLLLNVLGGLVDAATDRAGTGEASVVSIRSNAVSR